MDRDARVRAARRRQALDALAFERDRERMLAEELEDVLAELDGERVDAEVFARMSAPDAELVRDALGGSPAEEGGEDDENADGDGNGDGVEGDDRVAELEEEVGRLEGELAASLRVQAALERYVDELANRPSA